jgi:F-type H+-transporting ATPase subunit b
MKRLLSLFALTLALLAVPAMFAQEHAEHDAAAGEHGAAAEERKAEDPMLPTWKWANFALLAIGMGYMLMRALPASWAERTATIQKDIREAQAVKADAEKRAAQVEARVASLGADIEKFRTEAASDMAHEGERIRQETTAQIKRIEAQSALEIETAGKIARRELKQFSAELALKMAEDRVRAKLDGGAESNLVDGFVAELARQGSKN